MTENLDSLIERLLDNQQCATYYREVQGSFDETRIAEVWVEACVGLIKERFTEREAEIERLREHAAITGGKLMAARVENDRLREALGQVQMQERARCLNLINSYVLRTRVKPHGAVGLALAAVANMMKGADDD